MSRNTAICPVCQCSFADSDCTHWKKYPGDDAWRLEPIIDPDEDNLVECGPAGLGAFLPDYVLDPPAVSVYLTFPMAIANDVEQLLFFNKTYFDTDSMHDETNRTEEIVIHTEGIYLVSLNIRWQKNGNGDRAAWIRKNGSDMLCLDSVHAGNADLFLSQSLAVEEHLKAGDVVEALVKQDSGADFLFVTATRWSPVFSATFQRPAPVDAY